MPNDLLHQIWVSAPQLEKAGVDKCAIHRKTKVSNAWEWKWGRNENNRRQKLILLSSMEERYQQRYVNWWRTNEPELQPDETPGESDEGAMACSTSNSSSSLTRLNQALKRFPLGERDAWIAEIQRLAEIIQKFDNINPKRVKNPSTGKYEFTQAVITLCNEAACTDALILSRESGRAKPPSPFTLDGWLRGYRKEGLLAFIRSLPTESSKDDRRKAQISEAAAEWVNANWRNFRNPTHLYKAAQKRAKKENWQLPSKVWFFRRWKELPNIVLTHHIEGSKAYVSRYAPYVPRDYSDLEALQIVCGDHSERDLTVQLRDGSLARPWLTSWQDLRTGLIWGWHLSLVPSSHTAGMAYADGVMNFGAQPVSRPDDNFFSYVYTDQGRDYKSHNWDGNTITVHKHAMRFDGGIEVLRVQRQVGFLDEIGVKHLLARGYNAKEKPIERFHRDISDFEENTFEEYCGRDAKSRPDAWHALYSKHKKLERAGRGNESPVIGFDEYREALAGFIHEYNTKEHERSTLGGARVIPLEEYRRLYTTRYEIAEEALALLLMKAEKRIVRKNGVQCFQKHWFYFHSAMAEFKGKDVEVRYSDADYSRVWVFLPDGQICEAQLITATSILNPNKQTLGSISEAAAHERKVIREHSLLTFSTLRGENTEDRVAAQIEEFELEENEAIAVGAENPARVQSIVQSITRMDKRKLRAVPAARSISVKQVSQIKADDSIFHLADTQEESISEFDYEE
ncbi:MAG: transposase [Blastocatellia bacterium]